MSILDAIDSIMTCDEQEGPGRAQPRCKEFLFIQGKKTTHYSVFLGLTIITLYHNYSREEEKKRREKQTRKELSRTNKALHGEKITTTTPFSRG